MSVPSFTQKTPNKAYGFRQRRLTNTPRRHRLADGQLSSPYAPLLSSSSFVAASRMLCCLAPPASWSAPLRPSVPYRNVGLVVKIIYICILCGHVDVLQIFGSTCIVLMSAWSSTTARMPASSLVLPCLRLTPQRRHANGQLSPLWPLSPSFSSFGAACSKLCCLLPLSLIRNISLWCLV